jgi:hypothetical protein
MTLAQWLKLCAPDPSSWFDHGPGFSSVHPTWMAAHSLPSLNWTRPDQFASATWVLKGRKATLLGIVWEARMGGIMTVRISSGRFKGSYFYSAAGSLGHDKSVWTTCLPASSPISAPASSYRPT